MKCQLLFSAKNKKNITNLCSAEFSQRAIKVNNRGSKNTRKLRWMAVLTGETTNLNVFYWLPFDLL